MEWKTSEGFFEYRDEDNKSHPVLPLLESSGCILACAGVACFTGEEGFFFFYFEGSLLDFFKGSQRKGYQNKRQKMKLFLLALETELKHILIFFTQRV